MNCKTKVESYILTQEKIIKLLYDFEKLSNKQSEFLKADELQRFIDSLNQRQKIIDEINSLNKICSLEKEAINSRQKWKIDELLNKKSSLLNILNEKEQENKSAAFIKLEEYKKNLRTVNAEKNILSYAPVTKKESYFLDTKK